MKTKPNVNHVLWAYHDYSIRRWFIGDAAKQRALKAHKVGECVFPVEIETEGLRTYKIEYGWGIGKKP